MAGKEHSGRGRKLASVRKHSSRPRRRRPPMRRVSRKGAYKASQKQNFMRKRAAVTETKRKTAESLRDNSFWVGASVDAPALFEDTLQFKVTNSEIVHINPKTFYWWSQGLDQAQHIGQCVNVKHLNQKIQVRFPQHFMKTAGASGSNLIVPNLPQSYELIWGWIPAPRNLTGLTTPPANAVTVAEMDSYVNNRIKDYYNSRKDKLRFIPRKDVTIRISGSRKIRPDLRFQSTAPLVAEEVDDEKYVAGTIPDWYGDITWKMPNGAKKLWLEQSGNLTGTPGNTIGMYPNYSWLPFSCVINWNHDETVAAHGSSEALNYMPAIATNDIVYFTDS